MKEVLWEMSIISCPGFLYQSLSPKFFQENKVAFLSTLTHHFSHSIFKRNISCQPAT